MESATILYKDMIQNDIEEERNMRKYEEPRVRIILSASEDVITISPDDDIIKDGDNNEPWIGNPNKGVGGI